MQVLKSLGSKPINSQKKVKVTSMGNIHEIMYMEKMNVMGLPITKIDKHHYLVHDTGEIKEYAHIENRSQSTDSLRKTFKRLRALINTNFEGAPNELCFTITYKENMCDPKLLYKDFEKFWKKLKYKYPDVENINVVEPQERGAWHCHVLLKFTERKKIYIPNKEISQMWGKGFVSVKAMRKDVDNMGAYLSAYLGDIEVTTENCVDLLRHGHDLDRLNIKEVELDGKKKKFIKGGRLHMYPTGMNIYRKSKGIQEPIIEYMQYKDTKKIVGSGTPHYSTTVHILDDELEKVNTIIYEQYNTKR